MNSIAPSPLNASIIDMRDICPDGASYLPLLAKLDSLWTRLSNETFATGALWVMARNRYDAKHAELLSFPHDLISRIRTVSSFKLRNVLVVYSEAGVGSDQKPLACAHFMIPFFVKSLNDYFFDKDAIREPHIFKDIEWGRRKVGKSGYSSKNGEIRTKTRYSPKGRDPGNVFYKTTRNADGYVLAVTETSDEEILEKLVKVSVPPKGMIGSNIHTGNFHSIVEGLGRTLVKLELDWHA